MEEEDYKKQGRLLDGFPRTQSTDIGRTLVSPPTGLSFLDVVPDEVLEELVRIGVGHRRTESVSWDLFVSRGKGSGQAGAVPC